VKPNEFWYVKGEFWCVKPNEFWYVKPNVKEKWSWTSNGWECENKKQLILSLYELDSWS
jgi:hypothetical protein